MISKIEALLDAIGKLNGCFDPEQEAYRLRNPLLIKSFARPGKHQIDEKGRRIFSSFLNGYKACLFDLELKVSGRSRARVDVNSTLEQLLACYEIRTKMAIDHVISFVRRALNDQSISAATPVSFFADACAENEQGE